MTHEETVVLQIWKLVTCIALQRMGGLIRITEDELKAYVSDGQAPAYQAVPEGGVDVFLLTKEEIEDFKNGTTWKH